MKLLLIRNDEQNAIRKCAPAGDDQERCAGTRDQRNAAALEVTRSAQLQSVTTRLIITADISQALKGRRKDCD